MKRPRRHAGAGCRGTARPGWGLGSALLVLALGLLSRAAAPPPTRSPAPPIAVTPPPGRAAAPAMNADPGNLPVIATTRPAPAPPPVPTIPAPVQPTAFWPGLKPPPVPPPEPKPAVRGAALALSKVGPDTVSPSKPLTYEIVVHNVGTAPAHAVRLEDRLPSGARYLGGEPKAATDGDRLVWEWDTLEAGAERRVQVEIQVDGAVVPAACGATVAFSTSPRPAAYEGRPRLLLTVAAPEGVRVGDKVVLRMKLANTGTAPAVGVVLHDQLPAGLRHEQGNPIEADLGNLGPGESRVVSLEVTAVQPGRLVNQVTAIADGAAPALAQTAIVVTGPALAVRPQGPAVIPPGEEAELAFEAVNSGTGPATGAHLTVYLPEGLQLIRAGEEGTVQAEGRNVEWALGTLDAGQSRRVSAKVRAQTAGEGAVRAQLRADGVPEAAADRLIRIGPAGEPPAPSPPGAERKD
ncbi:MAG TPA: hypothetical protein VNK04_25255 [Gemmataceae bacterium]|nr:hypothetical protein [Gemmataceae bacterium]